MYDGRQSGRDRAPGGACLGGERCPRGLGELLVLHSVPVSLSCKIAVRIRDSSGTLVMCAADPLSLDELRCVRIAFTEPQVVLSPLRVPSSVRFHSLCMSAIRTASQPTGNALPHIRRLAAGVILYPAVSSGCMPTSFSRSWMESSRRRLSCPTTQRGRPRESSGGVDPSSRQSCHVSGTVDSKS
eukprot:scaffold2864_cov422-Pavlova_lutheri.AAC.6